MGHRTSKKQSHKRIALISKESEIVARFFEAYYYNKTPWADLEYQYGGIANCLRAHAYRINCTQHGGRLDRKGVEVKGYAPKRNMKPIHVIPEVVGTMSPRAQKVMRRVAQGIPPKQIARELNFGLQVIYNARNRYRQKARQQGLEQFMTSA